MQREPVALATSIVRNSVALMAVGLLAKGMGLVIAVLVATDAMLESAWVRLAAGLGTYLLAALAVGLLPRAERAFLQDAMRHGLGRAQP